MKVSVIFDNFGPYHIARLTALAKLCDLTAIEIRARSREYGWDPANQTPFHRITLAQATVVALCESLDVSRPNVLFIPGWSSPAALAALGWCRRNGVPGVVMSDSQKIDFRRVAWRERIKGWILSNGSAAFVAGEPQRHYVLDLGFDKEAIGTGYDCVDNDHFITGSDLAREKAGLLRAAMPERYLLTSTRFIPKKNLPRLIEAFAASRQRQSDHWSLVILGDGAMRPAIVAQIHALGLADAVVLPGFRQYDELPRWYGLAEAFILASTSEQWGLVINEAMASGLPVLVSNRCGCARDLVIEGKTGFTFSPEDTGEISNLLSHVMAMPAPERRRIGEQARNHIAGFNTGAFADSAMALASRAFAHPQRRSFLAGRVILPAFARIAELRGLSKEGGV